MRVKVEIVRRPEIADPQGVTVVRALRDLGFGEVAEARFNRTIVLDLDVTDILFGQGAGRGDVPTTARQPGHRGLRSRR